MIYIYDRDEKYVMTVDTLPKITQEIGNLDSLSFESDEIFEKGYRVVYYINNKPKEFIIVDTLYERDDDFNHSYYCKDSLQELKNEIVLDKRPTGNFIQAINSILENTRWTVRNSGDYQQVERQNSFYRIPVLEALGRIVERYGIEYYTNFEFFKGEITKREIVIGRIGKDTNQRLEFGKNIEKFERKILPQTVITALYVYGKGEETESGGFGRRLNISEINQGKEYVENLEALEKYGVGKKGHKKHVFDTLIYDDIEDVEELKNQGLQDLEILSKEQVEYEVRAVDLDGDLFVGDLVTAVDDEINFYGKTRIIKVERIGDDVILTFGKVVKGFTEEIKKVIREETEQKAQQVQSQLASVLDKLQSKFLKEDGYNLTLDPGNDLGLPGGLYSFEKPLEENPLKAIYIGAGKMLIWTRANENAEWELLTAIDENGINGQAIITNSITANKLASDVGQQLDLSSNESVNIMVGEKGKYRNIITNSDWYLPSGAYSVDSGLTGYKVGSVIYDKKYGTLGLSASLGVGKYLFNIPLENAKMAESYTLWIGSMAVSSQVRNLTVKLLGNTQYTYSSDDLTPLVQNGNITNQRIKLIKWPSNTNQEPLKWLRFEFEALASTEYQYVRLRPELLALVEGDVPNLAWDMTYLASNQTSIELTKNLFETKIGDVESGLGSRITQEKQSILADVGSAYLKLENFGTKFGEEISKVTLKGSQIELNGNTKVGADFTFSANHIKSGLIEGAKAYWDLNSGLLSNGDMSVRNIQMYEGNIRLSLAGARRFNISGDGVDFHSGTGNGSKVAFIKNGKFANGNHSTFWGHNSGTAISLAYYDAEAANTAGEDQYRAYVMFDRNNTSGYMKNIGAGYYAQFNSGVWFGSNIRTEATAFVQGEVRVGQNLNFVVSHKTGLSSAVGGEGIFIGGRNGNGLGITATGAIYQVKSGSWNKLLHAAQ